MLKDMGVATADWETVLQELKSLEAAGAPGQGPAANGSSSTSGGGSASGSGSSGNDARGGSASGSSSRAVAAGQPVATATEAGDSRGLTGRVAAQVLGLQKQMSRAMQSLASLGRGDSGASRAAAAAALQQEEGDSASEETDGEEAGSGTESEEEEEQQQASPAAGAAGAAAHSSAAGAEQQQQLSDSQLASLRALLGPGAWQCCSAALAAVAAALLPLLPWLGYQEAQQALLHRRLPGWMLLLACLPEEVPSTPAVHQAKAPSFVRFVRCHCVQAWKCAWRRITSANTQVTGQIYRCIILEFLCRQTQPACFLCRQTQPACRRTGVAALVRGVVHSRPACVGRL